MSGVDAIIIWVLIGVNFALAIRTWLDLRQARRNQKRILQDLMGRRPDGGQ